MNETDKIVEEDFSQIGTIMDNTLLEKYNFLKSIVEKIVEKYSLLKNHRDKVLGKMENCLEKVDKFLESSIAKKFQKLKSSILFIKSQTNLENPVQTIILK